MQKQHRCLENLNIFVLSFLFVVTSLLAAQSVYASEALIINGKTQMRPGKTQFLSLMNYRTGLEYTWTIESGSGNLSTSTGEKVEYIAPDSNPDCVNNPTIGVTDSNGNYGQIQISVNCYTAGTIAYKLGRECIRGAPSDPYGFVWSCAAKAYGCNGEYLGPTNPSSGCYSGDPAGCGDSPEWCDICGGENEFVDIRTLEMKASGCCPEAAQPSFQPRPSVPSDVDLGRDPQANHPICDPSLKGNPIRIYNGNNLESVQDIRLPSPNRKQLSFWRFYNSRSDKVGPLGYGWTHGYSAYLETEYEYKGDIYLRIVDESGHGVYFQKQGDGNYAGSFNERSHVNVEGENYIWYRYDGTRFAFESSGRLIWVEDELGNQQLLTYDLSNQLQSISDEATGAV